MEVKFSGNNELSKDVDEDETGDVEESSSLSQKYAGFMTSISKKLEIYHIKQC